MIGRVEARVTFAAMADNLPLAERALAMARAAPPTVVANACLVVAIGLGWIGGDLDRAERLMDEALDFAVADDDCRGAESWITRFQGLLLLRQGDLAERLRGPAAARWPSPSRSATSTASATAVFLGRTAILLGDLDRAHANLVAGTRRCRASWDR